MLELLRVPNEELLLEMLFYPTPDSTSWHQEHRRGSGGVVHPKKTPKFQVNVVSKEWE